MADEIAIVGMSCRFPGNADSPNRFWRNLLAGHDAIGDVPELRWSAEKFYSTTPGKPGFTNSPGGGFIEGVDLFDADLFGISPREARAMDPQHRLALELTWTALESANIVPSTVRDTPVGIFLGLSSFEYFYRFAQAPLRSMDVYIGTGNTLGVAAGRISHIFGFEGPSMVIDTTCSSSLVSLHAACNALKTEECDLAIAGGVHLTFSVRPAIAASGAGMLSPAGRCRVFDQKADGFVRGEGGGLVVLKPLSRAQEDGDHIYATVIGSAVNQDGASFGLTVPSGPAQQRVIRRAHAVASINADDVGYVEAHGTGTALGDPIEVSALTEVFASGERADRPLFVGSVKSNIGHLEAAAGIAGLIKTVMAVHNGVLPPTLHLETHNRRIKWQHTPVTPVTGSIAKWPLPGRRIAGVSSFGYSGTNVHVIVAEAPKGTDRRQRRQGEAPDILAISARTRPALLRLAQSHFSHVTEELQGDGHLHDLCHTVNTRRTQFAQRAAFVFKNKQQLQEQLKAFIDGRFHKNASATSEEPTSRVKVGFLFTGQGAAHLRMGEGLYRREPVFRHHLDELANSVREALGCSPVELILSGDERLLENEFAQPALFSLQIALCETWRHYGVTADIVIGHSLGEIAAARYAGYLDLENALHFVIARGQAVRKRCQDGTMIEVVGGDPSQIFDIARDHEVDIAAFNAPGVTTFGGAGAAVKAFAAAAERAGASVQQLPVDRAFHTRYIDPAVGDVRTAAESLVLLPGTLPLVSGLHGSPIQDVGELSPEYWGRQLREPVRFADSVSYALAQGTRVFLEIGPQPSLSRYVKIAAREKAVCVPTMRRKLDSSESFKVALARLFTEGVTVTFPESSGNLVPSPSYPFDRRRFFVDWNEDDKGDLDRPLSTSYRINWIPSSASAGSPALERACIHVPPVMGEGWKCIELDNKIILPDRNALCEALRTGGPGVILLPMFNPAESTAGTDQAGRARELVLLLSDVARCIGDHGGRSTGLQIIVLCRNAVAVRDEFSELEPSQAAVWSAVRAIRTEVRGPLWRLVDVDHAASVTEIAAGIAAETRHDDPEVALREDRLIPSLEPMGESAEGRFSAEGKTYLITGASGGLGGVLARWLIGRGARKLVLNSRRSTQELSDLALEGARNDVVVEIIPGDVADAEFCGQLVQRALTDGDLNGVFHLAGEVNDRFAVNLTTDDLRRALSAKALGSRALDKATRGLGLETFVCFSSAASLLSSPGQSAYAAANGFMDALMHNRRRAGEAGIAINWGPWDGEGMVRRLTKGQKNGLRAAGISLLDPAEALARLDRVICGQESQVLAAEIDWDRYRQALPAGSSPVPAAFLPDTTNGGGQQHSGQPRRSLDLAEVLRTGQCHDLETPVRRYVKCLIGEITGHGPDEPLSENHFLSELGFDSLMLLSMKNFIESDVGIDLPLSLIGSDLPISGVCDQIVVRLRLARMTSQSPDSAESVEI